MFHGFKLKGKFSGISANSKSLTNFRNMGKHTTELNLKTPEGRSQFEALLAEADVLVDGYRHGALERLGFGIAKVQDMAKKRGKGIVYVSENCFGYGKWAERPGWQQIADCKLFEEQSIAFSVVFRQHPLIKSWRSCFVRR